MKEKMKEINCGQHVDTKKCGIAAKVRLFLFMDIVQMQSNRSKLFIIAQVSLLFAGAKFGS